MGPEYPKIVTLYKRHPDTRKVTTEYSEEVFAYLSKNAWIAEEKIDGMNIRVCIEDGKATYAGRTDKAQLPGMLVERLNEIFVPSEYLSTLDGLTLYGEGYGKKIQKGGGYLPDANNFCLFDARIGDWFLTHEDVRRIAEGLHIPTPPYDIVIGLQDVTDAVRVGFRSKLKHADCQAEGVILRPLVPLRQRNGARIIAKLKTRDF